MRSLFSPSGVALSLVALAHAFFALHYRDLRPDLTILTQPPSPRATEAMAFGDSQFLYRVWALNLQNAGDTGGRATPMRDYNYDYVLGWLDTLRALDPRAEFHTFIATHYFSQTPEKGDVRKIVDFIVSEAENSPQTKWPWLLEAAVIAQGKLSDLPLAVSIAKKLTSYDFADMPNWVLMFPAALLEQLNRPGDARAEIEGVVARRGGTFSEEDKLWVANFYRRLSQ
jgi:hypothetical protein